jgi:gentisate 1,2-dioxygenase
MAVQSAGIIVGFALFLAVMLLGAVLLLFPGRRLLRRYADWLFNRRGVEKLGAPLRVRPQATPYEDWLSSARTTIPVHDCLIIDDVRSIELRPWAELGEGVSGLYLRLADYQITDGRLLELPPGGTTVPARHMFEMGIYMLGGPGYTELDVDGEHLRRIEWSNRDVLSIPINTSYRHVNRSDSPVRLLAITSFPFITNVFNSQSFIEDNPFRFPNRLASEPGSVPAAAGNIESDRSHRWQDKVSDVLDVDLIDRPIRGKGVRNRYWNLFGNSMISINVSEMPGQSIKRAHRANSDAVVLMLSGEGACVTWPDGAWFRKHRFEFREGTLFAAPIYWYRQFLNTSPTEARNLTMSASGLVTKLGIRMLNQMENDLPAIIRIWKKTARQGH